MKPASGGWLMAAAALGACSHASGPADVSVYHSLGSRQCEGGGLSPEELATRLHDAGIRVAAINCGSDGRMRPAMCGTADGRLAVFDIPADHLPAALAQGFRAWSELREGRRMPCRGA